MSSIGFLYWEIFVLLFIILHIDVAWTERSDLEGETKCQLRTLSCSCDEFYNSDSGFKVDVTYRDCDDGSARCQNCDHQQSICGEKKVYVKCRKAFVTLLKRKRREMSTVSHNETTETPASSVGLPSVTIQPRSRDVLTDGDVTFECKVYPNTATNITWLFNGEPLSKQPGKTLTLKRVDVAETGNYTCVVENEYGKTNASASLNVVRRDGPQIIGVELEGQVAYLRSNINITCKSFNSESNIFFKNAIGVLREKAGKYTYYHWMEDTTSVTSLEIQNITMEDAGNYSCFAVRSDLRKNKTYLLKVAACPPGFYCPLPDNKAMPCEPGTYRNASDNITSHCNNCLPGHYCPRKSVEPILCYWGTYMPFNNASSLHDCIPCPQRVTSGKDAATKPAVSRADCPPIHVTDPLIKDERASVPDLLSTPEIVGAIAGTVGALVIIIFVSLYCTVKRTRCLSTWLNKASSNRQDLESFGGGTVSSCNGHLLRTIDNNTTNSEVVKAPVELEYETLYDVFICYSSKDTSWVKTLVGELESRDFRCCIDFRDFVPGAAILQNISEAIYSSRKTIAVLSPDFVESEWCSHELQKALTRIRFHQVVPIVYRNCEIPLVLRDRTYLDWENCHVKPYFWEQLERAMNRSNDNGVL